MNLAFSKMHGAGNDFIVADNSAGVWPHDALFIRGICKRRLGVGGDGLILVSKAPSGLRMDYFNSDGSEAALCGNGLRCAALFAQDAGLSPSAKMEFDTASGKLNAEIIADGLVKISMPLNEAFKEYAIDPEFKVYKGSVGVPHAVIPVWNAARVDVKAQGRRFRFHRAFMPAGANVDFIELPQEPGEPIRMRTYERGVEDETLACGTGAVAAAICARLFLGQPDQVDILCAGGDLLRIELTCKDNIVLNAHLTGPALLSFRGTLDAEAFGPAIP